MSVTLTPFQQELIEKIARKKGFDNYDLEQKAGSIKGDNYLGVINTITITERKKPNKQLHLILKSAQENETLREAAPIRKAYEREIYMYGTIFPELRRLENPEQTGKFIEIAEFHGGCLDQGQECLILENLRESNFQLFDRMSLMNEEHAALVFQTYGKFHGLNLALKTLDPEKFQQLTKDMKNIFTNDDPEAEKKMNEKTFGPMLKCGFEAVAGNEKGTKFLQSFAEKAAELFRKLAENPSPYRCILHGDCWCNNMLFKYENEDLARPKEMRLLDWQLCTVDTPIMDLTYFLFTNCSKEVMEKYEKLLKIYHESLSRTVKEAGCNPDEVFPWEALLDEWKRNCFYGLVMALFLIKTVVSKSEDAVDLKEMAESGKDMLQALTSQNSNVEMANKRIADVVMFYADHNLI